MIMEILGLFGNALSAPRLPMIGLIAKAIGAQHAKDPSAQPQHMIILTILEIAVQVDSVHLVPHPHTIGQIILAQVEPLGNAPLVQPQHMTGATATVIAVQYDNDHSVPRQRGILMNRR